MLTIFGMFLAYIILPIIIIVVDDIIKGVRR